MKCRYWVSLHALHKNGRIDLSRTERQILMAIDRGVNYFDTAYIYHGGERIHTG